MDHEPGSLEQQMRQVLAELALLPHGKIASYNPSGGGDSASDIDWREVSADDLDAIIKAGAPQGESWPPHLKYCGQWNRAVDDDGYPDWEKRESIVIAAIKELNETRKISEKRRPEIKPETDQQFTARIIKEGEGWSVKDTANHMKCTETRVRRARTEAGVSQADGLPFAVVKDLPAEKRAQRAREMREQRMTVRQIAMHLGCDPATVSRDLAA